MAKFHVNPQTGNPGACRATKSCPFGDLDTDHYDSKEAAQAAFEARMGAGLTSAKKEKDAVDLRDSYDFASWRLADAIKRIEKANAKAEKAGIEERFTYTTNTYEVKTEEDGITKVEERVRLTLDRPVLQHQGWSFAGTMTWDKEAGLITRMVPGEELLEKPEAEKCDVCKTTRHRTDTYIVQKGDEQQQVGSACLERFMGIKPAGLWMMSFDLDDSKATEQSLSKGENIRDQRRENVQMVALGLALVERNGWLSRSAAYESGDGRMATADQVEDLLFRRDRTDEDAEERRRVVERAEQLRKDAEEVLESARTIEGDSEYAQNLRALAHSESVTLRNMPLLLSAIAHRQREKDKALQKKINAGSEWVGEKDEKLGPREVTVEGTKYISSFHGGSTLVTMRDDDGNIYKTFYTGDFNPQEGDRVELASSKVKDHKEWQGAKETMIGLAKFRTLRPATQPPTALPADSIYADAWTVEENNDAHKAEIRRIKKEMKKRAGRGNWDNGWDKPNDPALVKEWDELERATNAQFHARYRELTEGLANDN